MSAIKEAVRRGFHRVGIDVRRKQRFHDEFDVLAHLLRKRNLETVVDVGANVGQFALNMRRAGYLGRIVSFEPMPNEHATLAARAADDPRWVVPAAVALSDTEGTAEIHVAGNSISSSILPMCDLHLSTAPRSGEVGTIKIPTARLDQVLPEIVPEGAVFLKLDVQGYEGVVLSGATKIMDRVSGIKTEVSFAELYERQVLFDQLHASIRGLGFELWDVTPGLRNQNTGRLLQCDAVYLRPGGH
jgi:FkbM family methyltransferase